MTNHMYRSNKTPETEHFKNFPSAMHFGSDAAASVSCVLGGGGGLIKGQGFSVIGLHYFIIC